MFESDKTKEKVRLSKREIFNNLIEYFITKEPMLMSQLNDADTNYEITKENIIDIATKKIKSSCEENWQDEEKSKLMQEELLDEFNHYMWGYYKLEPVLADREVMDITLYEYNRIRVEIKGVWQDAGITFENHEDYVRFVRMICTRNRRNLSQINAQVKFTDARNNPDYILRFNLNAGLLNKTNIPEVHIRKIPKDKYTVEELVSMDYMTKKQAEFITKKIQHGCGVLFSGSNGSGKTFGLNAFLEKIPKGQSIGIYQESDELFTDNPDALIQHVTGESGEGKKRYGLKELANMGLMDARDIFVLGEVKSGPDAASLPMVAATGSQLLLTCHGNNEMDAIYKLADYVKQETGYELDQCLRFLTGINVVIFCKKFKIHGISYIRGWDYSRNCLDIVKLDENCNPIENKLTEMKVIRTTEEDDFENEDSEITDVSSYILNTIHSMKKEA